MMIARVFANIAQVSTLSGGKWVYTGAHRLNAVRLVSVAFGAQLQCTNRSIHKGGVQMNKSRNLGFATAALLLIASLLASGQTFRGPLTGSVTDASHPVITAANVN